MPDHEIDLEIALRKFHELALQDGDLGYEYWYSISRLLKRAASMQSEIDALRQELETCRAGERVSWDIVPRVQTVGVREEHLGQQANLEAMERKLFQAEKAKAIALAQRCRAELDHSITKIGVSLAQLGEGNDLSPDSAEIVDVVVGRLCRYQDALRKMLAVVWWHSDATPVLGVLVLERLVADKLPEARQEALLDVLSQARRIMDFRGRPGLRARLEGVSLAASYLRQLHDQWMQQLEQGDAR